MAITFSKSSNSSNPSKNPKPKTRRLGFRNKLAFLISLLSLFFLFPGIYFSMLTITSQGKVAARIPHVEFGFLGIPSVEGSDIKHLSISLIDTSRSIINVIHDLWNSDYHFVAAMIFLFSIIVPVLKGILLFFVFFSRSPVFRSRIFTFIKSIGKWSMCDVFITATFLAYLGTGAAKTHNANDISVMGYTAHIDMLVGFKAQLHAGFWYFLTYCILSLVALQLYKEY